MTDLAVIRDWLAGFQIIFGLVGLVVGLRTRGGPVGSLAPLAAIFLIQGAARFLTGVVAEGILISVEGALVVAALVWFVRVSRAERARTRELLSQRANSRSLE
jgi:hypothetical protein